MIHKFADWIEMSVSGDSRKFNPTGPMSRFPFLVENIAWKSLPKQLFSTPRLFKGPHNVIYVLCFI
jgi:hypothetical protein